MDDIWARVVEDLISRISGPLHFRFVLQPVMASILAIIAGWKDAKDGKPPYFWSLLSDRSHRMDMLKDGWKSVGRLFVLAIMLDIVYQIIVQHFVYPGEAVIVAVALAIVPYILLRGMVTRLIRIRKPRQDVKL